MKRLIILNVLLIFLIGACQKQMPGQTQVKIEPKYPQPNETLRILYAPGIKSTLATADSVVLQALFIPVNPSDRDILEKGRMNEVVMKRKSRAWQASLTPDQAVGCIVFQFKSGNNYDNNNGKGWDVLIYTAKNKPVEGAWSALSQASGEGIVSFLMNLKKFNADTALTFFQNEMKLYPDNWRAKLVSLNQRYRKALKKNDKQRINNLIKEMETYLSEHPNNKTVLETAYIFYYRLRPDKAKAILKRIARVDPKNRYVLGREINRLKAIKDTNQRLKKMASLESTVAGTQTYFTWSGYMLQDLSALHKWDKVIALGQETVQNINHITKPYPSYSKEKARIWKQSRLYIPLMALAKAYHALGKNDEAEKYYNEIGKLRMYPHQEAAYFEDYTQFLLDEKKYDEAAKVALNAIKKANATDKIVSLFKKAYTLKTGDAQAAEDMIAKARKESGTFRKKELAKTMIPNPAPAPAFSAKTLDGKTVSLTDLRGKTVILDFWATWCNPCKASFPYLQKFWEQHQNDPKIALFAVNTRERIQGAKRINAIKKFMKNKGYTFPVLLDDKESSMMKAFEVGSIPTKFFIGPDGKIYFKEIGFHGPSMAEDMNIQIKLINEKLRTLF